MKKLFILGQIKQELDRATLRGRIAEIQIKSKMPTAKSRSLYLAECDQGYVDECTGAISEYLNRKFPESYSCEPTIFESINQAIKLSEEANFDNGPLESNWRCRLMRPEQILPATDEKILHEALRSVWRIFIVQRGTDFFVRHDIFPALWYPGFSVAGFPYFESSLVSELKSISRQNGILTDWNFDVVKLFAKETGTSNHIQLGKELAIKDIVGNTSLYQKDLLERAEIYFGRKPIPNSPTNQQQTTNVGGVPHAITSIAGVQVTRAAIPGNPKDYYYDPVINSWLRKV